MKALQLSVITAEGLDKNRVLVSWELSPFSTHYPSESSLDGSTVFCRTVYDHTPIVNSRWATRQSSGRREILAWGTGKEEPGVFGSHETFSVNEKCWGGWVCCDSTETVNHHRVRESKKHGPGDDTSATPSQREQYQRGECSYGFVIDQRNKSHEGPPWLCPAQGDAVPQAGTTQPP